MNPRAIDAAGWDVEGELPYLRFGDDAQEQFDAWRSELEERIRTEDMPEVLEAHLSKFRSLVPSPALVIHLADEGVGPVSERALLRACTWAEYLESHARRVYAQATSPELSAARLLLQRIRRGELGTEFFARDAPRRNWSNLTDRERLQEALDLLVAFDWLRAERRQTGGRPCVVYMVNPTEPILEAQTDDAE